MKIVHSLVLFLINMGASTSSRRFHSHPDLIVVHVVPASQYSTKVLAALSQRRLKHALEFAHGEPSRRVLPSGGDMVPELEFAGVGTPDSAAILRFLDERLPELAPVKFFPTEEEVGESVATRVNELERLAEAELDLYCNYFNFVNDAGHRRSVRQSLARYVPWWAVWMNIDELLAGRRAECTEACRVYFANMQPSSPEQQLDESVVRAAWLEMLGRLEANFECEEQSYLCGTAQPTAADFGVFAKLARMQDHLGDVSIGAGFPDALTADSFVNRAPRLVAWYNRMRTECPLVWRNKRIPAADTVPAASTL